MKARTKSLVVTAVVGGVMAIASLGWACTFLVGPTYITDTDQTPSQSNADLVGDSSDDTPGVPAASSGSSISAKGAAFHEREPGDCDDANNHPGDDTPRCDYELITAKDAAAFSCHYNDGEEATESDATESQLTSGVTELNGSVATPGQYAGEAVACFRSKETFNDEVDGPPAAGTSGAPFLVLNTGPNTTH